MKNLLNMFSSWAVMSLGSSKSHGSVAAAAAAAAADDDADDDEMWFLFGPQLFAVLFADVDDQVLLLCGVFIFVAGVLRVTPYINSVSTLTVSADTRHDDYFTGKMTQLTVPKQQEQSIMLQLKANASKYSVRVPV